MPITANRRVVLGAGLAGMAWPSLAAGSGQVDLIILNARIHTVDAARPSATALAVRDGRFVAVGNDVGALAGKSTRTIDAKGMTIVPGFIDCHNHASGDVLLYEVLVGNPFEVEFVTVASIIDKLKARAAVTPPGQWVEGFFYDDTKIKEGRPLNIGDLDQVSRLHPVGVHHRGGHTAVYNGLAFKLASITRETPNPRGGTIDRDANGDLDGRVTDNAMDLFDTVGTRPKFTPTQKAERARAAAAHMSKAFARYGLTSVHHEGGDLAALQAIRANGDLRHRVSYEAYPPFLDAMIAGGLETGFGDDWIRLGATAEHTIDGSFSERTLARSTPYPGRTPPYYGNITETQDGLNAWVEKVHRAGIQVNCHANGDVAIAMMLTAVEQAQRAFPVRDARPKITHCTLINDDLVRRIKAAGAIPVPFTSYAYYNPDKFKFYGQDLMQHCMAFRTFLDAGVSVCAGSDYDPGPFSPLMGMQGMVTRTGWNGETWGASQRITAAEALRINTLNGAHASREETIKGSIAVGKLADFVFLADDPLTIAPERIKDIQIVRTVTGGRTVYEA